MSEKTEARAASDSALRPEASLVRTEAHRALVVLGAKATAGLVAIALGFRAVSDDDYARVVIAQTFAHAPRLDPSGTSWLPAPFWLNGAAMLLVGRSLLGGRIVAFAMGLVSALLVYIAARWLTKSARHAVLGAVLAALFPWSARLGVATVPEAPTAALAVFATATLIRGAPSRWRAWGGSALLVATLSRYEIWFVALAFAACCAMDAVRPREGAPTRGRAAAGVALALAGPLSWMLWNRAAHGDALHFVTRVTAYHRAVGLTGNALDALYVGPLLRAEPELLVAALLLAVALGAKRPPKEDGPSRWKRPLVAAAALFTGLVVSALRDGAPTHHAERPLLTVLFLASIGLGALVIECGVRRRWVALAFSFVVAVSAGALLRRHASESSGVDRTDEETTGEALRGFASEANSPIVLEAVDYGYLAVLAASGAPERFTVVGDPDPRRRLDEPPVSTDRIASKAAETGARTVVCCTLVPPGRAFFHAGRWTASEVR